MTDFLSAYQKIGGFSVPLQESEFTDSLAPLDPVRDRLLNLFASAINDELGSVWSTVVATLPLSTKLNGTLPVTDSYPGEPTKNLMTERKPAFPLLCFHRAEDPIFEPYILDADKITQKWHLHWILGPADIDTARRLLDAGIRIGSIIKMIERDFGHKSYEDGANQFEPATGALMSMRLVTHTVPGQAVFDDSQNTVYWACRYTIETTELVQDLVDHESDLEGCDLSMDVSGANSPDTNFDFIQASTDSLLFRQPDIGAGRQLVFDDTFDETFG